MSPEEEAILRRTVVSTLREAAGWFPLTDHGQILLDVAGDLERFGDDDYMCCVVCQETVCDSTCPLAGVRAGQGIHQP